MGPAACCKPPHQISTDTALALPKPFQKLQTLHCPSVPLFFLIASILHPWGHPSPHQGEGGTEAGAVHVQPPCPETAAGRQEEALV